MSFEKCSALDPFDMRKKFEGLYAAVGEKLTADVKFPRLGGGTGRGQSIKQGLRSCQNPSKL